MHPVDSRPILRGYAEYADLPEDAVIRVCAIEEVAVESRYRRFAPPVASHR